uniref:GDNF family receptor alpha-like n=1 Tax=Scatophagus argus TaxID=75038 RepID=UPI001ED852AB|nr:GDNF family receptor alpha-like [Scatophagus argus]
MQLIHMEAAVILGIVIPQIFSISMSSSPSDCSASVDTCMSDLCKSEQALYGGICRDEGCQIKGSEVCNMTIQMALDQFPSLQGCACAWQEELCDSIQVLATQCHVKPGAVFSAFCTISIYSCPAKNGFMNNRLAWRIIFPLTFAAAQQKKSTVLDWQSSSLKGYVFSGAGSCIDQITLCISDAVCNRHLVPVLQACMADQCNHGHCQQATQQFYGSMPHNVAEMLVMCECEASDQSCVHMKTTLHSGTCENKSWICQDTVKQCVEDSNCRNMLKTFRTKCWSSEDAQCGDSELREEECFTQMDPALILGADFECKTAFLSTLGTTLHYPCSCKGVSNADLQTCNMIHDVLHNRSHFMTSWKSSSGPSNPPEVNESDQGLTWSHDYLLYAFAAVLLVGVAILMPLAVVNTIWMLRRDKTKCQHPQKSSCVVIL